MLISLVRTVLLLLLVVFSLRLMGKRQIGQLQPSELVITILLSQIAAIPMQDNDIPMINTVIATLVLVFIEILMSVIGLKSVKARAFLEGKPVIVVKDGVPDRRQLKRLRYTCDDLMEGLRQKDVFSLKDVKYAIAETNGSFSVLLMPQKQPVEAGDMQIKKESAGYREILVTDGKISKAAVKHLGLTPERLEIILKKQQTPLNNIFLLTCDEYENTELVKTEEGI